MDTPQNGRLYMDKKQQVKLSVKHQLSTVCFCFRWKRNQFVNLCNWLSGKNLKRKLAVQSCFPQVHLVSYPPTRQPFFLEKNLYKCKKLGIVCTTVLTLPAKNYLDFLTLLFEIAKFTPGTSQIYIERPLY